MTSPDTEAAPPAPPEPQMTVAQCAALLREHFPALFDGPPKPLKLRIQADINERRPGLFPKQAMSAFLRRHTMSDAYLKAMGQSPHRFDLDGQPAGEVSEEHRKIAQATLEERRNRHRVQRAAHFDKQRDEQREAREAERSARREAERAERKAQAVADRGLRAALLRDYETTTLTRENFCALKGVDPSRLDELLAQAKQDREQRRAFVTELAAEFKASGKSVADFAATKNLHPAQADRFLREAGAIGGGGHGRRPERDERHSLGRRGDERRGDQRRGDARRAPGPRNEGARREAAPDKAGSEGQQSSAGPQEPTEGA
jgi:sRNA-binding protein